LVVYVDSVIRPGERVQQLTLECFILILLHSSGNKYESMYVREFPKGGY
jgi:hypothetical protein